MKLYRSAIGFGTGSGGDFWTSMHFLRSALNSVLVDGLDSIGDESIVGCGFEELPNGRVSLLYFSDEASAMMFDLIYNPLTFWSQPVIFEREIEAEF